MFYLQVTSLLHVHGFILMSPLFKAIFKVCDFVAMSPLFRAFLYSFAQIFYLDKQFLNRGIT